MKLSKIQKNNGFTLIETLVAISILLIAITGPAAVAQNGLRAAYIARDQITAFYLAQDAIEYVKNTRDDNFISFIDTPDWLEHLSECIVDSVDDPGCTIDTTTTSYNIEACPDDIGCSIEDPLLQNSEYKFGFSGEESKFYRIVTINEIIDDREAEIKVVVGWTTQAGTERTIEVKENIFRWAPLYD